ncbi:MAG: 6-phosphogluconolactonase [Candidatus Puniceispirillaceae bacterium]
MSLDIAKITSFLLDGMSKAIAERQQACLVLSGGSSPVPVFEALSEVAFPWEKVVITLVDERAVPPTHEDSNHLLVKTHLLSGGAKAAQFVPLYDNEAAFRQIGKADVALLGMGTDGHFASLFPDMIGDQQAYDVSAPPAIIHTKPKGSPKHPRISMNLAMITGITDICLLLPNAEKVALYEAAKTDDSLPVHYLQKALGERLVLFS